MIRWSDWNNIAKDIAVPGHDIIPDIFKDAYETATTLQPRCKDKRTDRRLTREDWRHIGKILKAHLEHDKKK